MKDKDLYAMKLHDHISLDSVMDVIRVPGGWTYRTAIENGTGGYDLSTCFVPYNNEFDKDEP